MWPSYWRILNLVIFITWNTACCTLSNNQAINQSLLLDNKEESNDEYHWSTIYCTINIKLWQLPVWRLKQILSLVLQQVRNEGNPDDVFVNKYKMSLRNTSNWRFILPFHIVGNSIMNNYTSGQTSRAANPNWCVFGQFV